VHFKGSGFYATDYGRGAKKKDAKDAESPSKDGKTGDKAAEKPAEKTSSTGDKSSSPAD
jgi:hypothetical protein